MGAKEKNERETRRDEEGDWCEDVEDAITTSAAHIPEDELHLAAALIGAEAAPVKKQKTGKVCGIGKRGALRTSPRSLKNVAKQHRKEAAVTERKSLNAYIEVDCDKELAKIREEAKAAIRCPQCGRSEKERKKEDGEDGILKCVVCTIATKHENSIIHANENKLGKAKEHGAEQAEVAHRRSSREEVGGVVRDDAIPHKVPNISANGDGRQGTEGHDAENEQNGLQMNMEQIDEVIRAEKHILKCTCCGESGSYVKNGTTRYAGRVIKCNNCSKQLSGKTVTEMLDDQLGKAWRDLSREQALETTRTEQKAEGMNGETHNMSDVPGAKGGGRNEKRNLTCPTEDPTYTPTLWRELITAWKDMKKENDKIRKENENMRLQLFKIQLKVTKLENAQAVHLAAGTQRDQQTYTGAERETVNNSMTPAEPNDGQTSPDTGRPTTGNVKPTVTNLQQKKINWAQIVKGGNQIGKLNLPQNLSEKIKKSKMILEQTGICQKAEPNLIPVYFSNVKRGPINVLRKALRESLPSWSVVGLSFIGGSVLEVLTDRRLKDRLVTTLQAMGLKEIINFDLFKINYHWKKTDTEKAREDEKRQLERALYRLKGCLKYSGYGPAHRWYKQKVEDGENKLQDINKKLRSDPVVNEEQRSQEGQQVPPKARESPTTPDSEGWQIVGKKKKQGTEMQDIIPNETNDMVDIPMAKTAADSDITKTGGGAVQATGEGTQRCQ